MKLKDIGEKPKKGQTWKFKHDDKLTVYIKDVVGSTVVYHPSVLKNPSDAKMLRVSSPEFKYMYVRDKRNET